MNELCTCEIFLSLSLLLTTGICIIIIWSSQRANKLLLLISAGTWMLCLHQSWDCIVSSTVQQLPSWTVENLRALSSTLRKLITEFMPLWIFAIVNNKNSGDFNNFYHNIANIHRWCTHIKTRPKFVIKCQLVDLPTYLQYNNFNIKLSLEASISTILKLKKYFKMNFMKQPEGKYD